MTNKLYIHNITSRFYSRLDLILIIDPEVHEQSEQKYAWDSDLD
jgi:hypothetical protein